MHVEIDYNMRVTSMLVNACNCLLDACNMHVTSTIFRIGRLPVDLTFLPNECDEENDGVST